MTEPDTIHNTPLGEIKPEQVAALVARIIRTDPEAPTLDVAAFGSSI